MGRKRLPPGQSRSVNRQFRFRPDYDHWLEAYAAARGLTVTEVVERALAQQARRDKFYLPPPPPSPPAAPAPQAAERASPVPLSALAGKRVPARPRATGKAAGIGRATGKAVGPSRSKRQPRKGS